MTCTNTFLALFTQSCIAFSFQRLFHKNMPFLLLFQIHPLGLCNTSDDGDLYEYGWVGVVKLMPPDELNEPCFTLLEKVCKVSLFRNAISWLIGCFSRKPPMTMLFFSMKKCPHSKTKQILSSKKAMHQFLPMRVCLIPSPQLQLRAEWKKTIFFL